MRLNWMIVALLLSLGGLTACTVATPTEAEPPAATVARVLTEPQTATAEATALTPAAEAEAPMVTPTPSPQPTAANTPVPAAASTATPTAVISPTAVVSATAEGPAAAVVTVNEDLGAALNVRAGPGVNYPVISQLQPGQTVPVSGRNEDSSWWQVSLADSGDTEGTGWVYAPLVTPAGDSEAVSVAEAPAPPAAAPEGADAEESEAPAAPPPASEPASPDDLADQLRCGKDFCVTYQAMVPIWENGGCMGNHSIYITVLEGPPPGRPLDGVVIGDTFGNVEVASGDKGPGQTEITLWMNSMSVKAKRHVDGTPYTSEESFNFTSHDELIPAEVLAANGYCDGSVEKCRQAQQQNQICRGHYSWRVTLHKFD